MFFFLLQEECQNETVASNGSSQRTKRGKASQDDPYDFEDSQPSTSSGSSAKRAKRTTQDSGVSQASSHATEATDSAPMDTIVEDEEPASITDERFNAFKKSLTQLFRESRAQSLPATRLREYLGQQHSGQPFRAPEIRAAFDRMTEANQIMVADDIIFLI